MLKTRTLIALSIVAALFFLTGVQVFTYAQMSNETSMGGNMTNATMGNATAAGNMTGNISGFGPGH
jgi:uncharacterized membrane protein